MFLKISIIFATRMMKSIIYIWFIVSVLVGSLVGCKHMSGYDNRLVVADSLLDHDKHASLESLSSLNPKEFTSNADKAYYNILLTLARYKCFVPVSKEDSVNIDLAVRYFNAHKGDHDKLTRAHISRGAVLEELGYPDSAMTSYKMAEANAAANNDYFNLGYSRLRMGKLYYRHYAYDGRDIEKLEKALDCFKRAHNIYYQLVCMRDLGALYSGTKYHEAENVLNEAIGLAKEVRDTDNLVTSTYNLAALYYNNFEYEKSYNQLQVLKSMRLSHYDDNYYATFASVYALLGLTDSAEAYLQKITNKSSKSINYLEAISNIALSRGDSIRYLLLKGKISVFTDTLLRNKKKLNIMYAEDHFDKKMNEEQRRRNNMIKMVAGIIILLMAALAVYLYRRSHRYDRLILELKDQSQSQMTSLTGLQENINEMKINDERLKDFISSHMGMMREMIEACYHEPNNRIAENMKRIVKFQDSNRENWVKLYDYIDMEHNNIMTRTSNNYPQLNDRDLLLLALTSMGFSYIQTAIIMGYSNATSVSVIKQRLAKKMGIDCTLNEYIERNDQLKNEG